jgi:hypothetical protein
MSVIMTTALITITIVVDFLLSLCAISFFSVCKQIIHREYIKANARLENLIQMEDLGWLNSTVGDRLMYRCYKYILRCYH